MNWSYNFKTKLVGIILALGFFVPYAGVLIQSATSSAILSPVRFAGSVVLFGRVFSTAEAFILADLLYCVVCLLRYRDLDQTDRSLLFLVAAEMVILFGQTRWFLAITG